MSTVFISATKMSKTTAAQVILLHGLNSSPLEFGLIAHSLKTRGIGHVALKVDGYTDADPRKPVSWRSWLDAATTEVNASISGDRPVVLGGLCMGGMLAAALALDKRCAADGLALLSPTFVYNGWGLSPWRHLRHFGYRLGLGRHISIAEREPFGVKNPKIRKWIAHGMKERAKSAAGPARLPLWALREGEGLIAYVRERVQAIECPTLVIHAREDEITRLASVHAVVDLMPARQKRLVVLENSYHMITMDNDRRLVVDEIACFARGIAESARTARLFETDSVTPPPREEQPGAALDYPFATPAIRIAR